MGRTTEGDVDDRPVPRRAGQTWYDVAPTVLLMLAVLSLLALVVGSALGWIF